MCRFSLTFKNQIKLNLYYKIYAVCKMLTYIFIKIKHTPFKLSSSVVQKWFFFSDNSRNPSLPFISILFDTFAVQMKIENLGIKMTRKNLIRTLSCLQAYYCLVFVNKMSMKRKRKLHLCSDGTIIIMAGWRDLF